MLVKQIYEDDPFHANVWISQAFKKAFIKVISSAGNVLYAHAHKTTQCFCNHGDVAGGKRAKKGECYRGNGNDEEKSI